MYFKFPCQHCKKSLKVKEEHAGRRAKCPYCGRSVVVPKHKPEDIPVARTRPKGEAGGRKSSQPEPPDQEQTPSTIEWSEGTEVSMAKSALMALGFTIAFYLVMIPLSGFYFGDLFLDRGWVPYVLVFLMGWSFAILALKWRKLSTQRASMLFDLLPTEISTDISTRSLDKYVKHVRSLPIGPANSILINRVLRGLEHFRVRKNSSEVARILASQSDIDATSVQSSYKLIKVFIWAIPILGFIGTVIGISSAVGGFAGELGGGADIEALKDKLGVVTQGLGVAFDTTLVALVMSLLVSFPAHTMQKAEEDLVNWVDEYCNENLVKRLNDGDAGEMGGSELSIAVRNAIDKAMTGNHGEMLQRIENVEQRMLDMQSQQVERLDAAMGDLADRAENINDQVARSISDSTGASREYFEGMQQAISNLNEVLGQLNGKQVVIESHQPPKRRGWSLFGKRNGG